MCRTMRSFMVNRNKVISTRQLQGSDRGAAHDGAGREAPVKY